MTSSLVPCFTHYLVVSTEDHLRLVKGGIGTYLGLLLKNIRSFFPKVIFVWITESPSNQFEVLKGENYRIFYFPKKTDDITFFSKLEKNCQRIHKLFSQNPKNKIIIEAPDWEGILCHMYEKDLGENTFKVTRLHSILELTRQEETNFSDIEREQIAREHRQCLSSDLLASSTDYAYQFTKKIFSSRAFSKVPHCTIPNFINENFRFGKNKRQAVQIFRKHCPEQPINSKNKNIFVVGSLEKRKGVDIAIQIAMKLIQKNPDFHFYFLGHLEKEDSHLTLNKKYTRKTIEKLFPQEFKKNIHICGYFPYEHLHQIYALTDTFLFCYLHDNFPGALIEASLSGKNVVYLNRAGCKEMMAYQKMQLALPFNAKTSEKIIAAGEKAVRESISRAQKYTATQIRKKYRSTKIMKALCHAYQF